MFMPIINDTENIADTTLVKNAENDTAIKVIADHIRTVAFAIGDSALPSNEGRGYVLRRLLRRAVRFAKQIGITEPFMYKLVPTVGDIMKSFYQEESHQKDKMKKTTKMKKKKFNKT